MNLKRYTQKWNSTATEITAYTIKNSLLNGIKMLEIYLYIGLIVLDFIINSSFVWAKT